MKGDINIMKLRMKKITALMAAAVLGASTFGSVSVMAAESTEAMAVPADEAGMVADGDAVAADGDAIPSDLVAGTFKPSETTVPVQDSYEYPFLGLNFTIPEELQKQMKDQTVAMISNEEWNDNADAIKYAYLSWSEMTEEQKNAEVDKLGTAYQDWCNSLAKSECSASMTRNLRKNSMRSQDVRNTKSLEAAATESINTI